MKLKGEKDVRCYPDSVFLFVIKSFWISWNNIPNQSLSFPSSCCLRSTLMTGSPPSWPGMRSHWGTRGTRGWNGCTGSSPTDSRTWGSAGKHLVLSARTTDASDGQSWVQVVQLMFSLSAWPPPRNTSATRDPALSKASHRAALLSSNSVFSDINSWNTLHLVSEIKQPVSSERNLAVLKALISHMCLKMYSKECCISWPGQTRRSVTQDLWITKSVEYLWLKSWKQVSRSDVFGRITQKVLLQSSLETLEG